METTAPVKKKRQRLSREKIIQAALFAWRKTEYFSLTMESVAAELACSKPALYRYFPSKDELTDAVQEYAVEKVAQSITDFCGQSEKQALPTILENLLITISRLTQAPESPAFCVVAGWYNLTPQQKSAVQNSVHTLLLVLEQFKDLETARFALFAAVFWTASFFLSNKNDSQAARSMYVETCLQGIHNKNKQNDYSIRYDIIEKHFLPSFQEGHLQQNHIFAAIQETVAEFGIINTTVQKIADRVGMSVSSLYFYFSNRSEMLLHTLQNERKYFKELFNPRMESFSGSPLEKVYGYFLALESYFQYNPELITVGHWLRSQSFSRKNQDCAQFPEENQFPPFLNTCDPSWFSSAFSSTELLGFVQAYATHFHHFRDRSNTGFSEIDSLPYIRRKFHSLVFGFSAEHKNNNTSSQSTQQFTSAKDSGKGASL